MIVEENSKLIEEKHELIKKLDSNHYENDDEKEKDSERLGELNLKILQNVKNYILESVDETSKMVFKKNDLTIKDLRKIRKDKREEYRILAKQSLELYKELVNKKQQGVELEDKLSNKNFQEKDLKKLTNEVLRY